MGGALGGSGAPRGSRALDWTSLLRVAEREMATPVLQGQLSALRRDGLDLAPPPLDSAVPAAEGGRAAREGARSPDPLEVLGRLGLVHEFRLREFQVRFGRLMESVSREGLEVLLLKGAALVGPYYPSMIDRPMSDVDLLVRGSDTERLRALAADYGWRSGRSDIPDRAYDTHHHQRPMSDAAGLWMGLEIHTGLFPQASPFALSADDLWRESEPARLVGPDGSPLPGVRIPAPHHLLLHNALHFTWSHAFRGVWKALRDVNVLVDSGRVDWDRFVEAASRSRGTTGAYWTLELAREWTGVAIPPGVLRTLDPGFSSPARRALIRHFGAGISPDPRLEPPTVVGRRLWELAMRPNRSGHGRLRPWNETEKWLADEEGQAAAADDSGSRNSRPRESGPVFWAGKGFRALRYLAQLVRPV